MNDTNTAAAAALLGFLFSACAFVNPPLGDHLNPAAGDTASNDAVTVTSELAPPVVPHDVFATLNAPDEAHKELCNNDGTHPKFPDDADRITKVFCQDLKPGGVMPAPKSLAELQALLGLDFKDPNGGNGVGGNPAFAILGHSSALTARKVSTITPTTFVFTPPPTDGSKPSGYVFLAFDPGEQFVEVASHDPVTDEVNLYLVVFDQGCTHAKGGCTPTNLLTPQLTTGWSNVRIYESGTALNNTIADCRQCHAANDKDPQILRMQEITAPFTHWFSADTAGGRTLLGDFQAAHGTKENYGGIPAALVAKSDPSKFAQMVTLAGFGKQPNAFNSAAIEAEVQRAAPAQPARNNPPGKSATWQASYEAAIRGNFIAAPYHDVKITDPTKLAAMTHAYQSWMAGSLPSLPNIGDVFLDTGLRDMGFAAKANLNGRALLIQLCQQCHNPNLDQTLSRALFDTVNLDKMTRAEKDLAIERILLPDDTRLKMPPVLFRSFTTHERDLMVAELKK
ncbi:MAG: hypothetical protein JWM74_6185 [Myxococcaceae bacterium]|nr:hypothetical protein [Myxococcaceae bacterium]